MFKLQINSYDEEEIAYSCDLLFEAGLIKSYNPTYFDDSIYVFSVGPLTWVGHDFLEKIREDTLWNKTQI